MTNEENEIMKDIYFFLRDHGDPPPINTDGCEEFWFKAGQDLVDMVGKKWDNHPLAQKLGFALIVYIENKSKDKAGEAT